MLKKLKITAIALYTAGRENCVRAYMKCVTADSNSTEEEKFTIVGFFNLNEGEWRKESNENCTLEILLDAMHEKSELVADITEGKNPCLSEGSFVFGK